MKATRAHGRRNVIIVGPGRHFGLELVNRLLSEGCGVCVTARTEESVAELRSAFGRGVLTFVSDVGERDLFRRTLTEAAGRLESVDGLIYNPKVSFRADALATDAADLDRALSVNVTGAMVAIQTLLPWLQAAAGTVVLTGGGYKDRPAPDKFALAMGKAGLHGLYRSLSQPLQRRGIRLNTVVIDGAVRRGASGHRSSISLADFYWSVIASGTSRVHRFPSELSRSDQFALAL